MGLAEVVLAATTETLDAYRRLLGPDADSTWSTGNARLRISDEEAAQNVVFFGTGADTPDARLLTRRGLALDETTCGLRARDFPLGVAVADIAPGGCGSEVGVEGVDHLVFLAAGRDHAVALFGATFGIDYRLAQSIPGATDPAQTAVTQLFFRDRDLVVEVLANPEAPAPVDFWGIAWRVTDLDRAREVLSERGFDLSEIRAGRKPGTRVCTVRDRALGVATLLIDHDRT